MKGRAWNGVAALVLAGALSLAGRAAAQGPANSFPDVPPWHWAYQAVTTDGQAGLLVGYPAAPAELVENAVTQIYGGFAHAHSPGAQAWIERFTYNRPASWPAPLERSAVAGFVLNEMRVAVAQDTATATFNARVTSRSGGTAAGAMHVAAKLIDGDWKIDYTGLAAESALFR
jgi:hypothetical protein